ncbi:MAG: NOL1/NOP2/sun family putative RNA methylase [Nanoarchaeota archaeon]
MEYKYQMKPVLKERMQKLLPDEQDFAEYERITHEETRSYIRCNTLKISIEELFSKLSEKWSVKQPFPKHPEIMLVLSDLMPGELGNSLEHTLGYYYIQEISSMLPVLSLNPEPEELVLDVFASPGSKTTQIAAKMNNTGTLLANDLKIERIKILSSNTEKCGVTNCITTRNDAINLCGNLSKTDFKFDKILLDSPCSGEGIFRSSPKTMNIWNFNVIKGLSKQQKKFISLALKCLKKGGTLVYSTCTHAPEENEEIVDFALSNFPVKIENISLPLKSRPGITEWDGKVFHKDITKCARIYPQDNDSEGFFPAKLTLLEEIK